jgi:hypothetical protein
MKNLSQPPADGGNIRFLENNRYERQITSEFKWSVSYSMFHCHAIVKLFVDGNFDLPTLQNLNSLGICERSGMSAQVIPGTRRGILSNLASAPRLPCKA